MRPGDSLRFEQTTVEKATAALTSLQEQAVETKSRPADISEWEWIWDGTDDLQKGENACACITLEWALEWTGHADKLPPWYDS